jgi:hypothetical protein
VKRTKSQAYPASKIKVGACLYQAFSYCDKDKVVTGFNEWIVYTIRARRGDLSRKGEQVVDGSTRPKAVNLVEKNSVTWGKISKKAGDYGWILPLDSNFRKQFRVGENLPLGIYTTKRAALAYELAEQVDSAEWYASQILLETDPEVLAEMAEEASEISRQVAALKKRIKSMAGK